MQPLAFVTMALAALAAVADANGVCYDPTHGSTATASSISSDMGTIAGLGFDTVRTYVSYYGSINVGSTITAAGLTAALGVPYPDDWSTHAQYAIAAAKAGGVSHIFVGNENLAGASSVPSGLIAAIQYVKSQVGSGVQVGTVQRNTEVINYSGISGWSDLVSACDVLGVNVHPFFTSGTAAENAMALVKTQWNTMYSNFGSKLLLTETGWPTSGSYGSNSGSVSGLQTFYSDYQSWMSSQSQSFFFQMFDTPYKSESYEQTFGLLTYDSQSKFGMASSPTSAPSTTSPATTAPATTAPSTPEPTTATPEPTTATPEPTTATPEPTTETPELASTDSSASIGKEADSTDGSSSLRGSVSGSDSVGSTDSVGSSSVDEDSVGSLDDEVADEADAGDSTVTTESATTTGTAGTSGTSGTSSDSQKTTGADSSNDSESANTQSSAGSSGSFVGIAIAGAACAALVAFGFIYQTRKRAQEMEDLDDKRDDSFPSAVTPVENINVL